MITFSRAVVVEIVAAGKAHNPLSTDSNKSKLAYNFISRLSDSVVFPD